jgi:predicted ATPase
MKSAYELAMERLQQSAPAIALTQEQKEQLAEIDSQFRARIAEKELFLSDQIARANAAGKLEEADQLRQQLQSETRRLHDDWENKKQQLRDSFTG